MNYYFEYSLHLVSLFLPFVYSIRRFAMLDRASRFFCFIAGIGFIGELVGLYSVMVYRTNLAVYNVIGILNLIMLCLYFNFAIPYFRKYYIGMIIGAVSVIVWTTVMVKFGTLNHISTSYMFFEGAITMSMSLMSIEQLITQKNTSAIRLRYSPHFWFPWILFCYWCLTLTQWALYEYYTTLIAKHSWINISLSLATITVNLCFFLVFFFYPKMKKENVS